MRNDFTFNCKGCGKSFTVRSRFMQCVSVAAPTDRIVNLQCPLCKRTDLYNILKDALYERPL